MGSSVGGEGRGRCVSWVSLGEARSEQKALPSFTCDFLLYRPLHPIMNSPL